MNDYQPESPIFLRKSSGLVKAAGPLDVFNYNFGLISVGIALTLAHFFVSTNYSGASLPLAEIISGIFMASIALGFWCWSVVIPRSGGVYAFVSRGLSPSVGFAVSFVDTFTWLFYNALAASYLITIGLSPALFSVGALTGSKGMMQLAISARDPVIQFVIGGAAIIISGIVLISGIRIFFTFQKVLLAIAVLGTFCAIIVLIKASPSDFIVRFDSAFNDYLPSASKAVLTASPQSSQWVFSFKATILAAVWPLLSYVGSIFSVNIGGEVRNVQRSQFIGMFGSLIIAALIMVTLSILGDRIFGQPFQAALGAYASGENGATLPILPYFSLLTALSTSNPVLAGLVCFGFFAWAFLWIPATLVYAARALIAWSFDRVAPAAFGYVHPKRHTPVTAIVVVVIANLIFLALFLFLPFFSTLVLVLAAMLAWIPTMLGALLFPYLRSEMFECSPMASMRLFGLPLMSVAGALGLIATLVLSVMLWNDSVAAGHSFSSLGTIGAVFALGIGWYIVVRAYRARQGLKIDKAFQEIPIE